jgi:hypothetical protein
MATITNTSSNNNNNNNTTHPQHFKLSFHTQETRRW